MSQESRRIFILEDDKMMRESLRMLIGLDATLEVCGATDRGGVALEQLPEVAPDLVLVDLSLPDMSGLDFVRQVAARHPAIATLVISGHTASRYAEAALDAGARGFVQKGLAGDLNKAIAAVLRGETYTDGT